VAGNVGISTAFRRLRDKFSSRNVGRADSQLRLGTISDYSLFANDRIKVPNLYFNFVQDPRGIKVDLSG
jgi:hypothetical protein